MSRLLPGPPAGPSSPPPPRNPQPLPRPAPTTPPSGPQPSRLSLAAVAVTAAGIAGLAVGFTTETNRWSVSTGVAADYLLLPLFAVFFVVSLAVGPRPAKRHRPAAVSAGHAGAAVVAERFAAVPATNSSQPYLRRVAAAAE